MTQDQDRGTNTTAANEDTDNADDLDVVSPAAATDRDVNADKEVSGSLPVEGQEDIDEDEEEETERYVLMIFQDGHDQNDIRSNLNTYLVMGIRHSIEDAVQLPREQVEIDVWLESPGGDAHAAYKLGLLLRAYAHKIRVIIPDYAKSAATLVALAADEIYMAPSAELGPLDAQIPNEGAIINTISALDIARSLDDLMASAMRMALRGGADVLQMTQLSRAETLSTMFAFTAQLMKPIVRQLDPAMIHWSNTLLDVAVEYGDRLLESRDHVQIPSAGPCRALVEKYPTHGFNICRDEARERLGLPVKDLTDYDFQKEAMTLHRDYELRGSNTVEFALLSGVLERAHPKPDEEEHNGGA